MKKILLFVAMMAGIGLYAQAETALFYASGYDVSLPADASVAFVNHDLTVTGSDGTENTVPTIVGSDFSAGNVTVNVDAENSNGNYSYVTGTTPEVRFYQGAEMTITVPEGYTITQVMMYTTAQSKGPFTANPEGTITGDGKGGDLYWNGIAKGVLTLTAAKQVRFNYMIVTYTSQEMTEVSAKPVFSPKSGATFGSEGLEVTITAAEGATIYWGIKKSDVTNVSTLYSGPILLTETATIQAFAEEEGKNPSDVVEARYVYKPQAKDNEVEIITKELGLENGAEVGTFTRDGVTFTFSNGENTSNAPKYYDTGEAIRLYSGNQFTVSSNYKIVSVNITYAEGYTTSNITPVDESTPVVEVIPGSYSEEGLEGTWLVGAFEGTFATHGTKGHCRIVSIKVILDKSVKMFDTLSQLVQAGKDSGGDDIEFIFDGTVGVTYQNGSYLYIQDDTAAMQVNGQRLPAYKNGDRIDGFAGTLFSNYYSSYVEADITSFKEGVAGDEILPEVVEIEDLTADMKYIMQYKYVQIENVYVNSYSDPDTYQADGNLTNLNNASIDFTNRFGIDTVPGDNTQLYNVVGILDYTNTNMGPHWIILPISFTQTSAIKGIELDAEDAEVYDLSGVRVNANELGKGVYVVRQGSKVQKVMVK